MAYKLKDLPIEILNLDLSPEDRWTEIITKYQKPLLEAYTILENRMEQVLGGCGKIILDSTIQTTINMYGTRNHYYRELIAISNTLNIPFYKIVMIQYGYEFFSSCTSAIVKNNDKTLHLRTMDWNDNSLRPLTIQLKVMKNDILIADVTTWAGFIGFMTVVKPNVCSISINHRLNYYMEPYRNLWGMLAGRPTISYLLRDAVLENNSYDDIISLLKKTPLSAPCYITIGCVDFEQSMILVRDRNDCKTHYMNMNKPYLVQTNIDPDDNRESMNRNKSIERRSLFSNWSHLYSSEKNKEKIMQLFLKYPIIKFNTIYACIMTPSDIECLNYTKYVAPSPNMEIMITGKILDFWNQLPPQIYDEANEKYDSSIYT